MDRRWLTFAVLLVLLVGVSALIVLLGPGDQEPSTRLQLQRATAANGFPELLVTVADALNVPGTTEGRGTVGLICRDRAGEVVIQARHEWPLLNDGEPPAPHVHQPASRRELAAIDRCRLTGTTVALRGRLAAG